MTNKKVMFTCVVAALLLAPLILVTAQNQDSGSDAPLGSWKVRIIPNSLPPLDEFMTFSAGGGIVEHNNFPFYQIGLATGPGHGTWSYHGRQQFPFTFIKYLFTPQGDAAGTLKVTSVITYSQADDTWSSEATVVTCDTMVNNCMPLDVTKEQATRIVAGL